MNLLLASTSTRHTLPTIFAKESQETSIAARQSCTPTWTSILYGHSQRVRYILAYLLSSLADISLELYRGLIISNLRHLALDGRNLSDHGPKFSRFENLLTITVIFDVSLSNYIFCTRKLNLVQDSEVDKNYGPWRTMEISLYQSIRQKYGKFSWTCPLFVLRHATDFIFDPFGVPKLYEEMRSRGLFARQSRFCYSTIPGHQELEDYLEEVTKDYA